MTFSYKPVGVCSRQIDIEIDKDVVKSVKFTGGCTGNTTGISKLVVGMNVDDVISRLQGIKCRPTTSCPDQLAQALIYYNNNLKK